MEYNLSKARGHKVAQAVKINKEEIVNVIDEWISKNNIKANIYYDIQGESGEYTLVLCDDYMNYTDREVVNTADDVLDVCEDLRMAAGTTCECCVDALSAEDEDMEGALMYIANVRDDYHFAEAGYTDFWGVKDVEALKMILEGYGEAFAEACDEAFNGNAEIIKDVLNDNLEGVAEHLTENVPSIPEDVIDTVINSGWADTFLHKGINNYFGI